VAAAVEGAFFRRTSIAVSLEYDQKIHDFPTAARYARTVIEQILAKEPADGSLFNVNIPVLERGPIKGVKVLPQNVSPYAEQYHRRVNPRGRIYFWSSPEFTCPEPHPDTDVAALDEGFITVTPLKFDLTDHIRMKDMQAWKWAV
jgi:5'-nucleotidase